MATRPSSVQGRAVSRKGSRSDRVRPTKRCCSARKGRRKSRRRPKVRWRRAEPGRCPRLKRWWSGSHHRCAPRSTNTFAPASSASAGSSPASCGEARRRGGRLQRNAVLRVAPHALKRGVSWDREYSGETVGRRVEAARRRRTVLLRVERPGRQVREGPSMPRAQSRTLCAPPL